jgi:hypothetical protein
MVSRLGEEHMINLNEIEWSAAEEARFHKKMAERATLSEEERAELRMLDWLGLVIRVRALGASLRSLEKGFGGSRSWWGRLAPALADLVSQVGQDGWNNPSRVKEALSQMGQETHERLRQINGWDRQSAPPAASDDSAETDETLAAALANLGRLLNQDPSDIVPIMTPERRAEAERLAPLVAAWLRQLEDSIKAANTSPGAPEGEG